MKKSRLNIEKDCIAQFFQLSNKLQTFLDRQLKQDKLTIKQFFLMIVIGSFDSEPGFSKVSARFGTSRQNVKQLALKLQKNNFIKIYTDKNDARYKHLSFTEKGNRFWQKRDDKDRQMLKLIFDSIPSEHLSVFLSVLMELDKNIDNLS
ncbi:MAG: MarR family winged helix-turn-helix transcriptional regulator [Candidatus Izimaplasma sp.]|nr:MarR family winged helix-turn-helix transcriptional regulator [Candidatus Izimaplasma bacterium]